MTTTFYQQGTVTAEDGTEITINYPVMSTADKYSHDELSAAFSAVSDPHDWKNSVCAVFDATRFPVDLVENAVEYFTATKATCTHLNGNDWMVEADGYYAGPAA